MADPRLLLLQDAVTRYGGPQNSWVVASKVLEEKLKVVGKESSVSNGVEMDDGRNASVSVIGSVWSADECRAKAAALQDVRSKRMDLLQATRRQLMYVKRYQDHPVMREYIEKLAGAVRIVNVRALDHGKMEELKREHMVPVQQVKEEALSSLMREEEDGAGGENASDVVGGTSYVKRDVPSASLGMKSSPSLMSLQSAAKKRRRTESTTSLMSPCLGDSESSPNLVDMDRPGDANKVYDSRLPFGECIYAIWKALFEFPHSAMFREVISPSDLPEYFEIIRKPTNLISILAKVPGYKSLMDSDPCKFHRVVQAELEKIVSVDKKQGRSSTSASTAVYTSMIEFKRDVMLMLVNALSFNHPDSDFHRKALKVLAFAHSIFGTNATRQ